MAKYGTFLIIIKNEPDKSPIQILWVHEIEENNKIQAKYSN